MTAPTARVLPERVAVTEPAAVEDYLVGVLWLLEDRTGGRLFPDPVEAVRTDLHPAPPGRVAAYTVDAELNLPDHRRVVVTAVLNGHAEAGKVRLELLGAPARRMWAWHFDAFHRELGGWGHEHRPGGRPERVLSSAQHLDAAVTRLFAEIWGLQP